MRIDAPETAGLGNPQMRSIVIYSGGSRLIHSTAGANWVFANISALQVHKQL